MIAYPFDAIGTRWQIDTPSPLTDRLKGRIIDATETFDRTWSRFRLDSDVAAMAAARDGGTFAFPPEADALFTLYDRLHVLTQGAVDPLVGRDLERLGYDRTYSLRPVDGPAPDRPRWREVQRCGATLQTTGPLVLDIGAAGKGLLIDQLAALLQHEGQEAFTIDGGGDIRHAGAGELQIGLEHPYAPDRVVGTIGLRNEAVGASSTMRRAWGPGLHHVIDGRTGHPTRDIVATWVVAPDAMTADGLATALFFAELSVCDHAQMDWVRMRANGEIETSPTFTGEIFL